MKDKTNKLSGRGSSPVEEVFHNGEWIKNKEYLKEIKG